MIRLDDVTKVYYGEKSATALQGITMEIAGNEFVSIVGPSGCGKSTLLKIIGGLINPTSGSRTVSTDNGPSSFSFVFQDPILMRWRTARENVRLPLEIQGCSLQKEAGIPELLKKLGLDGFEDSYPSELSGGMQQRVAIARALISEPTTLLLDEPFASLDEITRERLNDELLQLWKNKETTVKNVVFVTHNIDEAVFLSDRVIVLSGRPGEVKEEFTIDLPRERTSDVRYSEHFNSLRRKIRATIV